MLNRTSPRRSVFAVVAAMVAAVFVPVPKRGSGALVKDEAGDSPLVKTFLGKLEELKEGIEAKILDMKKGTESLVKGTKDAHESILNNLKQDLANVEKATAELGALIKSKPANAKDSIRRAMMRAWRGDDSLIKALDTGYLIEDKVREILPTVTVDGFDLMNVAFVKTVDADSTNIGLPALSGLGRGDEEASDFAAVSVNVPMALAWQYLGYSQQEFSESNLTIATENSKAYLDNRRIGLAREFVTGQVTSQGMTDKQVTAASKQCKGILAYATTITNEPGKLRLVKAVDGTAANLRLAIQAARNKLTAELRKVLIVNGTTKTLLESQIKASGDTYFYRDVSGRLMYEECEVWQNDNMPDVAASAICACVMSAGRAYGLGVNPRMLLSANTQGSKIYPYMGQGLGGRIVDHACIYGVTFDAPPAH